ncbi:TVP38/TMEM64 family protein [Planctomycetes bacterium K23_9]|uniref:TVP38/TMEM64 family membrane protein n=1 Tax=Stieleria marina TaxID=1930275 RepID=A0A517NZ82_9BACT|nr:SNARE associated Golgi protein [Planctomycetes bacterium K23_9]
MPDTSPSDQPPSDSGLRNGEPSDSVSTKPSDDAAGQSSAKSRWIKPIVLISVVVVIGVLFFQYRDAISLEYLAERESQLREFQSRHPWLVFGVAFLVYVLVTGLSLPGAAALTLVFGWYFGFGPALIMISFASTIGATLAFLLSRYLLGEWVQSKFGNRLGTFNQHLDEQGAFYLFSLRLVPAVPFFVINLVMGLTKMKTWTFYWVSQVGMLLGTAVFVYAGSRVPDLNTLADEGVGAVFSTSQLLQIFVAFTLLGVFPLVAKFLLNRFSMAQPKTPAT